MFMGNYFGISWWILKWAQFYPVLMINMKGNKPFWRFLFSFFQRKNWRSASVARREATLPWPFGSTGLSLLKFPQVIYFAGLQQAKLRNWWQKEESNESKPMAPCDAIQGPTATRRSHPFRVWHGTCGNFFYWRKHCTLGPFVDGIGFRRATWKLTNSHQPMSNQRNFSESFFH